jgi:microcin C transport system ATP-binding protein
VSAGPTLLSLRGLTVDFGSGPVVDDCDLDIASGERFALVGESGSGKSVTALSILRLAAGARYSGQARFFGVADEPGSAGVDLMQLPERRLHGIRGRDIAMIFQEPMTALNPLYSVGNQIVEALELHEGLSAREAAARAVELLARTGIPEPERRFGSYPHQLSGGQRQRAMIAMALACRPRLLIADEPTTALDVTIQAQILELLSDLQREFGMTVILITHDLNMVRQFAGRVGVMHQGRLVEVGKTEDIFERPRHDYTRVLLASRPKRMIEPVPAAAPLVVEARGLRTTFDIRQGWFGHRPFHAVRDLDIQLRRGETLGVVGESGSGKTTLGLSLLRLLRSSGEIIFEGQRVDGLDQRALRPLRKNMQVVFQDPFSSLSPRRTIEQIIVEGLALHFPEDSGLERRRRVLEVLNEVGLEEGMLGRYPHEFSGGQRQRIAIARAVVLKPALIVLDEPTSALDASVQKQVLELLVQLQRDHGLAYLFITHNLALINAIAHRVIVMKDGAVVEGGGAEEVLKNPSHAYTRELLSAAAIDMLD